MMRSRLFRHVVLTFVAVSLICLPLVAESKIQMEEVAYEVDGVKLTGYLAWDSAMTGKRPGVMVVHEWWGLNDYARMRARMLAELGYVAFAVDMYGDGKVTEHPDEAQKFAMEVMSNREGAVQRFDAARASLAKQPMTDSSKIAAIGYCFGGSVVLHMARMGADLAGVASFHGGLSPMMKAEPGTIKAKLLVLHGAVDAMAPVEQVEAFKQEMKDAGADLTFIAYPGAMHGFTNPDASEIGKTYSIPIGYDADADKESWTELEKFLERIFGK